MASQLNVSGGVVHGQPNSQMPQGVLVGQNYGPPPGIQMVPLNVPQGLEYLAHLDALYVKQKLEMLEAIIGFETKNRYAIVDKEGRFLFKAKEESDCCARYCCGPIRPFEMRLTNPEGQEIIHLDRPLACQSVCCPCWLQEMNVYSPPGVLAGTISQQWSIFPSFHVKDASGNVVLKIEGPLCTFSCKCGNVEFKVLSADGNTEVGQISKQWTGLAKEMFTDADNFGISFPVDLDIRVKATLVGACFLIDFMYFEKTDN